MSKWNRHWPTVTYQKRAKRWVVECRNCNYFSAHPNQASANVAYAEHANFYGTREPAK